jgi:hypothetical protein
MNSLKNPLEIFKMKKTQPEEITMHFHTPDLVDNVFGEESVYFRNNMKSIIEHWKERANIHFNLSSDYISFPS